VIHKWLINGIEASAYCPVVGHSRERGWDRDLSTRMRHGVREFTVAGSAQSPLMDAAGASEKRVARPRRRRFSRCDPSIGDSRTRDLRPEGDNLRPRPLRERRHALEQLVAGRELIIPTRRLPEDRLEPWEEVLRGNYEGMVAKDPASAYMSGRTLSWLKVKQRGYRREARGFDQP